MMTNGTHNSKAHYCEHCKARIKSNGTHNSANNKLYSIEAIALDYISEGVLIIERTDNELYMRAMNRALEVITQLDRKSVLETQKLFVSFLISNRKKDDFYFQTPEYYRYSTLFNIYSVTDFFFSFFIVRKRSPGITSFRSKRSTAFFLTCDV
jgi:hypothetical protein